MKRYRRFSHKQNTPILFFVSAFTLGTLLLILVFVVSNNRGTEEQRNRETDIAEVVDFNDDEIAVVTTTEPVAPTDDEYLRAISSELDKFMQDVTNIMGGWVSDPAWERHIGIESVAMGVQERTKDLEEDMMEIVVPSAFRHLHFATVLAVEDLHTAAMLGQIQEIERNLLRIQEIHKSTKAQKHENR